MTHVELNLTEGGRVLVRAADVLQIAPNGHGAVVTLAQPYTEAPSILRVTDTYDWLKTVLMYGCDREGVEP